jgi:hypothetical protein
MTMNRAIFPVITGIMMTTLLGCSGGAGPASSTQKAVATAEATKPEARAEVGYEGKAVKPGAPFAMSYRIIGTPVVGSPVTVELQIESLLGSQEIAVDYRINDATSMMLHEAQPERVMLEPAANEQFVVQRVTVVPQREGRMYLNVAASIDSDDGARSSIMAIPIQVGEGGRQIEEQGEVQLDEDGEAIRVLTND